MVGQNCLQFFNLTINGTTHLITLINIGTFIAVVQYYDVGCYVRKCSIQTSLHLHHALIIDSRVKSTLFVTLNQAAMCFFCTG